VNPIQNVPISKAGSSSIRKNEKEHNSKNEAIENTIEIKKKTEEMQDEKENKNSSIISNDNNEISAEENVNPIHLEIIEGPEMIKGTTLILDDKGIKNGKPNIHEGFTYFGCSSQNTGSIK